MGKIPKLVTGTPTNRNMLSPLNFIFRIKRSPHVNFFIQAVNVPGISIIPVENGNPFVTIPYSGEHMSYEELTIRFKVDEDLENYLEIHNWLRALGKPHDFGEYADIEKKDQITGEGTMSDITLTILNNIKNPHREVTFINAFPIRLSGLEFDTRDGDVQFLEATAEFRYTLYDIGHAH